MSIQRLHNELDVRRASISRAIICITIGWIAYLVSHVILNFGC